MKANGIAGWQVALLVVVGLFLGSSASGAAGQTAEELVTVLGCPSGIYVPNSSGHGVRPLTRPRSGEDVEPVTAPDGGVIAFARIDASSVLQDGIWLLDTKGYALRQLTRGFDTEPVWAPNGRKIAFLRARDASASSQVMVVARSGGHPRMLTRDALAKDQLAWSADGHWLSFLAESQAPGQSVYAVAVQTKRVKRFSPVGTTVDAAAWAPREDRLAYFIVSNTRPRIVVLDTRTGKIHTIRAVREQDVVDDLAWSPSGRRLAFTLAHSGSTLRSVYLTSASGRGRAIRLERSPADDNWPVWSPDGSAIAVARIAGNAPATLQAVVMRTADGRVVWSSPRLSSDLNSKPTIAWLHSPRLKR